MKNNPQKTCEIRFPPFSIIYSHICLYLFLDNQVDIRLSTIDEYGAKLISLFIFYIVIGGKVRCIYLFYEWFSTIFCDMKLMWINMILFPWVIHVVMHMFFHNDWDIE